MGHKYAFRDHSRLYFVTFTVVGWIDIFIREEYRKVIYDSIQYCQQHKGLEVYGYVIMTNHIHMIISTADGNLSGIVRDFKAIRHGISVRLLKKIQKKAGKNGCLIFLVIQAD